ncbi:MAG TPA: hypothetical protein VJJ22_01710 [Candidatus Paceibacterota bacterium]
MTETNPTIKEEIGTYSRMTPEEKETSAVRDFFMTREPRLAELPSNLKYRLEGKHGVTGQYIGELSGKFDGRELTLRKSTWDSAENCIFRGTDEGQELSSDEAERLYNDFYPLVVKFAEMRTSEVEASLHARNEKREDERKIAENLRTTEKLGREKGEKIGEISGILKTRASEIRVEGVGKEFLDRIITRIVELSEEFSGSTDVLFNKRNDHSQSPSTSRDYELKRKAVFKLLGVNEDDAQVWEAGFAISYIHSRVYDTIFADIIVREGYDRAELGGRDGSLLFIEKNSKYRRVSDASVAA